MSISPLKSTSVEVSTLVVRGFIVVCVLVDSSCGLVVEVLDSLLVPTGFRVVLLSGVSESKEVDFGVVHRLTRASVEYEYVCDVEDMAGVDGVYVKLVMLSSKEAVDFKIGFRLCFELVIKIVFKVVNRLTGAVVED